MSPVPKNHDATVVILIIKAGNSGAVVAGRLANSSSRPSVLLIEAGGDNNDDDLYRPCDRFRNPYLHPEIAIDYETVPNRHLNGQVLSYLRGTGLGGSSLANFLGYIRGAASDYNTWAEMVGDDTYKWGNVVERYKEIEALHFEHDGDAEQWVKLQPDVHGFNGPLDLELFARKQWPKGTDILMKALREFGWPVNRDQNSGHLVGVGAVTTTTYKGRRTTSSTAFLNQRPSNLQIWTNTAVHRVLFDDVPADSPPRAIGVVLADGREIRARKEIILSLGSIDTPKLLMLSGIGPKQELQSLGISCRLDIPNIGKELIDHPYVVLRWGATSELSDRTEFEFDSEKVAAAREQWNKDFSGPDASRNLSNLIGFLKLDPKKYSTAELRKLSSQIQKWIGQDDTPQFEVFLAGAIPSTWDMSNGPEALGVAVMLMNPQSRGSVTIRSRDPTAPPVIDTNFLAHPYDRRTYIDALREVIQFIRSKHLAKYIFSEVNVPSTETDEDILQWLKENLMSILHGVGTVKMGNNSDPSACVDTDMNVRGVKGLRVADLSVCPLITR